MGRAKWTVGLPVLLCWSLPAGAQQPELAPTTVIHIDAPPGDIILESQGEDGTGWARVCESPCDVPLPTSSTYRVGAFGKKTSGAFTLAAHDGRDTLHVQAADAVGPTLGIVAAIAGGALPILAFLGTIFPNAIGEGSPLTQGQAHLLDVSLVAGGVLLATGIVLLVTNAHTGTTVSQEPSPATGLLMRPAVATGSSAPEAAQPSLAPSGGTWFHIGGVF